MLGIRAAYRPGAAGPEEGEPGYGQRDPGAINETAFRLQDGGVRRGRRPRGDDRDEDGHRRSPPRYRRPDTVYVMQSKARLSGDPEHQAAG
jgi:hypothetical protein